METSDDCGSPVADRTVSPGCDNLYEYFVDGDGDVGEDGRDVLLMMVTMFNSSPVANRTVSHGQSIHDDGEDHDYDDMCCLHLSVLMHAL